MLRRTSKTEAQYLREFSASMPALRGFILVGFANYLDTGGLCWCYSVACSGMRQRQGCRFRKRSPPIRRPIAKRMNLLERWNLPVLIFCGTPKVALGEDEGARRGRKCNRRDQRMVAGVS